MKFVTLVAKVCQSGVSECLCVYCGVLVLLFGYEFE